MGPLSLSDLDDCRPCSHTKKNSPSVKIMWSRRYFEHWYTEMNNRTCRYSECSLALRTDIVYSRNSVHLNDTLLRLIERAIRVVPVGRTRERKARARDQREEEKKRNLDEFNCSQIRDQTGKVYTMPIVSSHSEMFFHCSPFHVFLSPISDWENIPLETKCTFYVEKSPQSQTDWYEE